MENLLRVDEAAAILKLNPETLRMKIRKNEIPGFFKLGNRDWRIKREDLKNWIDKQRNAQTLGSKNDEK